MPMKQNKNKPVGRPKKRHRITNKSQVDKNLALSKKQHLDPKLEEQTQKITEDKKECLENFNPFENQKVVLLSSKESSSIEISEIENIQSKCFQNLPNYNSDIFGSNVIQLSETSSNSIHHDFEMNNPFENKKIVLLSSDETVSSKMSQINNITEDIKKCLENFNPFENQKVVLLSSKESSSIEISQIENIQSKCFQNLPNYNSDIFGSNVIQLSETSSNSIHHDFEMNNPFENKKIVLLSSDETVSSKISQINNFHTALVTLDGYFEHKLNASVTELCLCIYLKWMKLCVFDVVNLCGIRNDTLRPRKRISILTSHRFQELIDQRMAEITMQIDSCNIHDEEKKSSAPQKSIVLKEVQTERPQTATAELCTRCIATGTINQNHSSLINGQGLQCVVMASCGFAYSAIKNQAVFMTVDVDTILHYANKIYVNSVLRGDKPHLIEPEALPTLLEIGSYKINVTRPNWKDNGLYALDDSELNNSIHQLELKLNKIFTDNEYKSVNNGFLFTGQNSTVSFWRCSNTLTSNDVYYLFNSHAVDDTGIYNTQNPNSNLARLFKIYGIHNLAIFLLKNSACDGYERQYSIHHIKVQSFVELECAQPITSTLNREQSFNADLSTLKPLNKPQNDIQTSENIDSQKTKRVIKRNRKKQTPTADLTASLKYVSNPSENKQTISCHKKSKLNVCNEHDEKTTISASQESITSKEAVQAQTTTTELGTKCIATGTMNQNHSSLKSGQGLQCVVMASCGFAYSVVKSQAIFTAADIDTILHFGNTIYVNSVLRGDRARLIEPEALPSVLEINNYKINVTRPNWKRNGMYARHSSLLNNSIDELELRLNEIFTNNEYRSINDGFLFTGQSYTVSFWRSINDANNPMTCNDVYYLFNSHAIDDTGLYNVRNTNLNRARLFKIYGVHNLAILLLKNSACDNQHREYSIHHIKVESFEELEIAQPIINTSNREQNLDAKLTTLKAIVLIEKMSQNNKQTSKNVSRPQIIKPVIKRGPKKETPNAHLTASIKYNASNPTVHRQAVSRYNISNPKISRDSSTRHRESHREEIRETNVHYNATERGVQPELRRTGLIGEKSGDELNTVKLFSLKKTSLDANGIFQCTHCNAKLFDEEKTRKQWCCGSGRYNILHLPPINERFYSDRQFVKYARPYNNLFSFSALGVSHGFQNPQSGLSFVKIQGRTYHRVFDLSYTASTNPIGLYIDDGEERKRLAENRGLNQILLQEINDYIISVNPFIDCFKRLSEEPSDQANIVFEHTTRRTHGNILGDMPRGDQISAILNTERETYIPRSICIWKIGQSRPHTVDVFNPLYEALQYPLLYPHGGSGWTINTLDNNGQKLSQVKYYRCLLLSEPRFWQTGRLSEEWLVDMYCRVEEERLRFISNLQKQNSTTQLRSATVEEIQNVEIARQIARDETVQSEGGVVPGRIYLPNTFTSSPRYMKCKYMDAMAIVSRRGKPSFFLTITCNPMWPEIQQNTPLFATQPPAIFCVRVFNLKLLELLRDLRSGTWFGILDYQMNVIEFQKRGLPHAHLCFRVEGGGPVQNVDIDKFIRADIPSEDEAGGRLRELVLKHMIHGPCGPPHRTDLPCWDQEKGRCNKGFPKRATDTTYADERGFIHLKRDPMNTATIKYRNQSITVNDLYVVPYCAALILKFECHINLENSSSRKVVKYLFKYITKGPDEARVAVVPEEIRMDEVEQYVTKRIIQGSDAAWRTLEFDVTAREPNVKQLPIHTDGQHTVFFKHGEESAAAKNAMSELLKYFNRPLGAEFDNITYLDFYENYIIHASMPNTKNVAIHSMCNGRYFVTKRQRKKMVARLFLVQVNRGEQFYLRILLSTFPCRSYADLYALGGSDCTTFQDAARTVGLANDEEEYERCMQEAATFYTGRRMRHFFVLLITNGAPASILWEKFKQSLCEDILERQPHEEEHAFNRGLMEIDRLLRKHGSRVQDHGLPAVVDDTTELGRERMEHRGGRLLDYIEQWLPLLSREQMNVFDYVKNLLTNVNASSDTSRALFLDGPSGTGKTLLLNVIIAYVRGPFNGVALCTASSGIAAQNYDGGCTAHSMFKLPIDIVDDTAYWNLTNGSQRAQLIRESSLIVYDEAPMAHKYLIHILERSLRDLMGSTKPFGNKIIIFAGDFRQIPPVVPSARCQQDVVQASLRTSPIWQNLTKFTLTEAQRTRDDEGYSDFLLALGSGACESLSFGSGRDARSLLSLQHLDVVTEMSDLIDFVFPENVLDDPDTCAKRAILCTINANVREINTHILERVVGDVLHCYSVDLVDDEFAEEFHLGVDTLNRIQVSGVPDFDLTIKKGCVCMIMRNLSFVDRLVNGTKVIVMDVTPRLVTVRKPTESETYLIPRILFKTPVTQGSPIEMKRRQFPLQVCYAMTIHKSQGQTIDRVGVDLRSDVFSHGQLYVALGRVRNKENIRILIHSMRFLDDIPYVNNVVIQNLIN